MAMSGVKLTEGCLVTYQDIQKSKKHRYAVFIIREGQIDVETVSFISQCTVESVLSFFMFITKSISKNRKSFFTKADAFLNKLNLS